MKTLTFLAVMLSIAAAPVTSPSDLKARLEESRANLKQAMARRDTSKAEALAGYDGSPEGKELVNDLAIKSKALAEARATGDAQEKLAASAAYNKAKQKLADAEQAAIDKDGAVRKAWDDIHAAQRVEAQLEKEVAAIPPPPAPKTKEIAVGMKLDEAVKIAGCLPQLVLEHDDGEKTYTLNVWAMDDELNKARGAGNSRNNPAVQMRKEYYLTVKAGVISNFTILIYHEG